MISSAEFLAGLVDRSAAAFVTREDFDSLHGPALRIWQELGFVAREPSAHPCPTCPHCREGTPYRIAARFMCNRCHSAIAADWLLAWPLHVERLLAALADKLGLAGGVRPIDNRLWQLGTWSRDGETRECFFQERGRMSDAGRARVQVYRNVLVLFGIAQPVPSDVTVRYLSLLEILRADSLVAVSDLAPLLHESAAVRFEMHSGALWVGNRCCGEVPLGSKEFFFLARLAEELDHFVPYADLKRSVLRQAGSADGTEEATFCQGLKSRIKRKWIPHLGRLITATNKADGYRLRGCAELQ